MLGRHPETIYKVKPPRWTRAQLREHGVFFGFISPWLFGFFIVTMIPLLWGFYLSLTNFTGFNLGSMKFTGAANYLRALNDPDVWKGLWHTAVITLIFVPANLIGGFGLAVLLNQRVRGLRLFRTIYYLPYVVPVVGMVVIWQTIYNRNSGLLNAFIDLFHKGTVINWISDFPNLALIVMLLWGMGGGMIIYLAALQGVPQELREAAAIDGASAWQGFRHITIPLVTPVLFFQLIMGIISSLQLLVPAMLLTSIAGGSTWARETSIVIPEANRLYMVHLFEQTFNYTRFGYGLALAWILFVIVFIFSLIVVKSGQFWVHYEVDIERGNKV
ncbi:MAG: carbohydrate ABC transporter permease [Patescibacteria group bacterium]